MEDTNPLKSFNYKGIYCIQSNAIKLGLRLTGGASWIIEFKHTMC